MKTFKIQFDKYIDLKKNIITKLLYLKSNLDNITPVQGIVDNNVIIPTNILFFLITYIKIYFQILRSELELIEDTIKAILKQLNESLNILSISDRQSETEAINNLTIDYKTIKDKLHAVEFTINNDDILKISKHIGSTLEKPKDTITDHIKTLKVIINNVIVIYKFTEILIILLKFLVYFI